MCQEGSQGKIEMDEELVLPHLNIVPRILRQRRSCRLQVARTSMDIMENEMVRRRRGGEQGKDKLP